MIKAFRYKIYPNKEQSVIGTHRTMNEMIDDLRNILKKIY